MKRTYITPKLREGQEVDLGKYHPRQRTNIRLYGLENKDWTPRDVFSYKTSWMPQSTKIHTHNLDQGIHWCKQNLYMHQWHIEKYSKPDDSHTFFFENPEDAMIFKLSIS